MQLVLGNITILPSSLEKNKNFLLQSRAKLPIAFPLLSRKFCPIATVERTAELSYRKLKFLSYCGYYPESIDLKWNAYSYIRCEANAAKITNCIIIIRFSYVLTWNMCIHIRIRNQ